MLPRPQKLKQLMDLRPVLLFSLAILSSAMFGAGQLGDCTNEIHDVMLYIHVCGKIQGRPASAFSMKV